MRRFPSSWDKTLTALGFRRKRRRQEKAANRGRRSRCESLERREMLSGTPNQPVYSFVVSDESDAYDPAEQFVLSTEYDSATSAPRAVLKLRDDVTDDTLDIALQEIEIELRQGEQVLETQSILVDIAEEAFLESFNEDRYEIADEVIDGFLTTPPPSGQTLDIETLLDVDSFEAGRRDGTIGPEEAADHYTAFVTAIIAADDLQTNADNADDFERGLRDAEALANAGLLLTGRLRQDAASSDPALSTAAESVSQTMGQYGDAYYTIFSGLGQNYEIAREENYGGAETFVLAIVEEPLFVASDSLRVELGGQQAMVQAFISSGESASIELAALTAEIGSVTQDTYVVRNNGTINGNAGTLLSYQSGPNVESHALFTVDLDGVSSLVPDSAEITLEAIQHLPVAGDPNQKIEAHYDFWSDNLWDEGTLVWSDYETKLASNFKELTGSPEVTVTADGDVTFDVTEAVQRALLAGDGNADGQIAAIPQLQRGDIEAVYLAATDKDAYLESFGGLLNLIDTAPLGGSDFYYRNDINWDGAVNGSDVYSAATRLDVLGDFNLDGVTDGADYSIWQANYGSQASRYQDGDANADNIVDAADYTAWKDGENKSSGIAPSPQLTFRVKSTNDGLVEYTAPSSDPSFKIDVTATNAVQAQSFISQPFSTGWTVDYEVLHDSGADVTIEIYQAPVVDDEIGGETLIHTSLLQSGSIGGHSHTILASEIDLNDPTGEYKLFAKIVSGGNVVSTREFEGGVFYDLNDALHIYGSDLDNQASVLDGGVFWERDLNTPQPLDYLIFDGTNPTPTSLYVQTGDGDDTLYIDPDLNIAVYLEGGRGDDTYSFASANSGVLAVQIGDTGGFDTLDSENWIYTQSASGPLDLRSADPQTFVDPATPRQITIDFRHGGEIQFVDSDIASALPISGPGYDAGPIVVDSLGHAFDGLFGEGELELREAIELANVIPGSHTIVFDDDLFASGVMQTIKVGDDHRISGAAAPFALTEDVVIYGPGADLLTLDAEHQSNIFTVHLGATAEIWGLTGTRGAADNGGAIWAGGDLLLAGTVWTDNKATGAGSYGKGGAIYSATADITVLDSLFENNYSEESGGAIYYKPDQNQELLINGSSFVENVTGKNGSALSIYSYSSNAGSVRLENSTLSGNHGPQGSVIYVNGHWATSVLKVDLVNTTVVENWATGNFPGGIYDLSSGAVSLENTILADNYSESDVGTPYNGRSRNPISVSHSLIGERVLTRNPVHYLPYLVDDAATGVIVIDAGETSGLMPLANYGGPTPVHALLPDSLAVNAGDDLLAVNTAGTALLTDQQGPRFDRILGDAIDIGAFESAIVDETVGGNRVVKVYGSVGDDQIFASPTGIKLDWHNSTDYSVSVDQQTDLEIYGNLGNDFLFATGLLAKSTTLRGEDGYDTLIGGGGLTNKLYGGADDDTVYTTTSLSQDLIYEGIGNDTYIFGLGSKGETTLRTGDGETAEGADTIDFSGFNSAVTLDLSDGQEQINGGFKITIEQGTDSALIENLIGTDHNDTLAGNDLDNSLIGNDGEDTLRGGLGDDYLIGGEGNDPELSGGPGEDHIQGNEGDDHLFGNDDADSLYGNEGDDELSPGDGVDVVDGGIGNDSYLVDPTESYAADRLLDPDGAPGIQEPDGSINHPPLLSPLPARRTVRVGEPYQVTLNADPADSGQSITYSYSSNIPLANVTFDMNTGEFEWTPTAAEFGQEVLIDFEASDHGSGASLTTAQAVTFLVRSQHIPSPEHFAMSSNGFGVVPVGAPLVAGWKPTDIDYGFTVDFRASGQGTTSWTQIYSEPDDSDTGVQSINISGQGLQQGIYYDFRLRFFDPVTGDYSAPAFTSSYVGTGAIVDYKISVDVDSPVHPVSGYLPVLIDWITTGPDPDYVLVEELDDVTREWHPLELIPVNDFFVTWQEVRSPSEHPEHYRVTPIASSGIAMHYPRHLSSGLFPGPEPRMPIDIHNAQVPSALGWDSTPHGVFIGFDNDFDRGYTNSSTLLEDYHVPEGKLKQSQGDLDGQNGLRDPDILVFETLSYGAVDNVSYSDGVALYANEYGGALIPDGVYLGNYDLRIFAVGVSPSTSKGNDQIVFQYVDNGASTYPDFTIPVTVVDIDLEIAGLGNLEEHTTGAIIQRNGDFSKGLNDAEGPIPDNNRDPATDSWVFDEDPASPGAPNAVLTPATLSWNAQVHEDLAIILNYPDDVLVWNVTGGVNKVISSGVPFMSPTDGMDLRIEGLERSEAWATTAIEAMFVDPDNYAAIVDTDEAKYTVVEFTALVDGDRDGTFSSDTPEDRSLTFWYNSDVDRVRNDNSSWPDPFWDENVPSDVTRYNYLSRSAGETVQRDADDYVIQSSGDLEDLSSLLLNIDPLLEDLPEGYSVRYSVELTHQDPTELNLSSTHVNFFEGISTTDSRAHIFSEAASELVGKRSFQRVTDGASTAVGLPSFALSPGNNTILFEASPEELLIDSVTNVYSDDDLRVIFYAEIVHDGDVVTSMQNSFDVSFRDPTKFYDRYSVDPASSPTGVDNDPKEPDGGVFASYIAETQVAEPDLLGASGDYFLLVHGWNMPNEWKVTNANTTMKRLYWQGYNGTMGTFDWPTFVDDVDVLPDTTDRTYNPSEFMAYRSAPVLKQLLRDLKDDGQTPDVLAHSMGNVVVGEALRLWQVEEGVAPAVGTYIAAQAAVHRDAYGETSSVFGSDLDPENFYAAFPPLSSSATNVPLYYHSSTAATEWVNVYNPDDAALLAWGGNNALKDNTTLLSGYEWDYGYHAAPPASFTSPKRYFRDSDNISVKRLTFGESDNDLGDAYELLSFLGVSDDRSGPLQLARPLGGSAIGGRFEDVHLNTLGYDREMPGGQATPNHSFQFLYDAKTTAPFWEFVIDKSGLSKIE